MSRSKKIIIAKRKLRVRSRIFAVSHRLRLSIYRSNKHIYAQVIDDKAKKTLLSENDKKDVKAKISKSKRAYEAGVRLGRKMKEKKINTVVFDRGPYKFSGRVKHMAQGIIDQGIKI